MATRPAPWRCPLVLPPGADRRRALATNYGLQLCGLLVLLAAGGTSIPPLLLGVVLFGLGLGNATSLPPHRRQEMRPVR